MRARIALVGFLVAMLVVHGVVAYWSPVQGEDWTHWAWAAQHRDDGVISWLASHFTFVEAMSYLLSRFTIVHAILSPLMSVALVVGVFTIALRRLPRATWDDVLGIALVSALIWITGPRAGLVWFHRPYVATHICGATLAVWLAAPYRCGWSVRRAWWPLLVLGGLCVGTSTRTIATASLVGLVFALRTQPRRERWMWVAFSALLVGTAIGYAKPPWIEFAKVFRRGLEANLNQLNFPIREAGELVSLVLGLLLVNVVLRVAGRSGAPSETRPNGDDTWRWFFAWLGISAWALFGPKYSEATLLPATIAISVAALPYLLWFAQARLLRYVLTVFAILVHVIVWWLALTTYSRLGEEGRERVAALEKARPGDVVQVAPYSEVLPTFWCFGEDFLGAASRQKAALEIWQVRDIELVPPPRRFEPDPGLRVALEVDGISESQLSSARPPVTWAGEPSVARTQFEQLVNRLRSVTHHPITARLVATNVTLQDASRPILIAWVEQGEVVSPNVSRSTLDANDRYSLIIKPPAASLFSEAWIVSGGTAHSTPYLEGHPRLQPMTAGLYVTVVCNPARCLVADAFVAVF
ncbi:MAG: hypothetical protein JWO36_3853 [Myxococcales bacterium]|nr:hypothetical protein [Myxococcales bacterium]